MVNKHPTPTRMSDTPAPGNLDITNFSVGAMLRAGIAVRQIVPDAASMESAAGLIVRYLYDNCVDPTSGQRTCMLVRFYKTHRYGGLEPDLQHFADLQLGDVVPDDEMRCLALLASAGDEPGWNSRHASEAHQAIPLPSADIVRRAPMIARLIEALGLDIESVVRGNAPSERPGDARNYDVFHVEDARDSRHVPAQADFVARYGVASVVGFGGLLRSGELFAVMLFSRSTIPVASAERFRPIALDIRSALYALDEDRTWASDIQV